MSTLGADTRLQLQPLLGCLKPALQGLQLGEHTVQVT